LKPRITVQELQRAREPGGAWELSTAALKAGVIEKAEAFLPYMLVSDRKKMLERIEAARSPATHGST